MLQWMAWKGEDTMMFIKFLEDGDSRNKRLTVSALEFVNHLLTPDYADTCVELYGLDMSSQELRHIRITFKDGAYTNTMDRALTNVSLPSGIDPQFIHVQLGREHPTTQVRTPSSYTQPID